MKAKTILVDKFLGIRNDVDIERLALGDLSSGVNTDLDVSGKPSRRLGYTRRITGTPSSFFAAGAHGYYLDGTDLKQFTPPSTSVVLRSGLSAAKRIAFVEQQGQVYYSNTEITGKISQGLARPWGISVPSIPVATASGGTLREGFYGYTLTYIRRDGQESGAPRMGQLKVLDNQGIAFTSIPVSTNPDVVDKNIYITGRNGETPMLVGTIPNAQTTFDYKYDLPGSVACNTLFLGPPPSGHLLTYFNGRILIAQGSYLWYTDAFAPERVNLRKNFVPVGGEITIVAPVESGVFVATQDRSIFLAGASPEKFVFTEVAPYGAPLGNVVYADGSFVTDKGISKAVAAWMSKLGLCIGMSDGTFSNMTSSRYILSDAKRTATVFRQRGGLTQFISTLFT
jgi:hypothetical protein